MLSNIDGAEPPLVLYRIILNPLNTKPKRMINLQTIYICHHPLSCSIELNRLNIKLKRSDLSSHNVKDPIRLKLFLRPLIHTQNYFQHLFILVLRLNLLNDFLSSFSIFIPPPFLHLFQNMCKSFLLTVKERCESWTNRKPGTLKGPTHAHTV